MPDVPTLVLCDDLVELLRARWNPSGEDGVEREYFKRWGGPDTPEIELKGRRVIIVPVTCDTVPETRGEDRWTHRVIVQVAERYPDAGDPPKEWIDERTRWVFKNIVRPFDFGPDAPAWNKSLLTDDWDWLLVDLKKLMDSQLFLSQVDFVFSELLPVDGDE